MTDEIGKELSLAELTELPKPCIVVTQREGRDLFATVWLVEVQTHSVHFYSGTGKIHFLALVQDGHLIDDTGADIYVYQYLGEP